MPHSPGERIFGLETEFGCWVDPSVGRPEAAVELVKDCLFYDMKIGALDLHARDDVFEPAEAGGFLLNGGRMYIDAVGSHLEYATAECRDLRDVVANDRAGHRLIVRALNELGLSDQVSFYNNSVDHVGGHTFGCHENYLVKDYEGFLTDKIALLFPFLVTRQIYAGVGRVGGHILDSEGLRPTYEDLVNNPVDYIWVSHVYGVRPDPSVDFQLSQRADHIIKTIASRVRFNRALINPKWEHYYSHDGYTRLHMLFGEGNPNEYAYALKVGTTHLMLRLLEDEIVDTKWLMKNPLLELRKVSRDASYRWLVELADGTTLSAIDLHREYLRLAERYRGTDEQTDWILDEWTSILDGLEKDPMALGDRVDWVAKKTILTQYLEEAGTDWTDDALHSVDMEYHNIDPEKSLFHGLQEMGETRRMLKEIDIVKAMTDPPANTRAKGRSKLVEKVLQRKRPGVYMFDWNGVAVDRHRYVEMPDPFETYEDLPDQWQIPVT
ncbi:MAG: proteasome accessory factor PafA2 family protein [Armatimonadetes bacterium]|nr:proteasome accessory factor PafA2 family protein [Armatimonadota bacterium]